MNNSIEKIKVLYVDDDEGNLHSFKANFRRDYQIFLASSAEEGLAILSNTLVHVIITDHRMPKMTGVEFFEKVCTLYPDSVRILLTGYSDIESVVNAINKGQVYRYITKPWNESELRIAIENAYEIYDVKKRLVQTNKELSKRNDELSRFVYSASHELKAPLATISGILKMAGSTDEVDSKVYLSLIEKSTNNLQQFVNSIVEYYRNQKYDQYLSEIDFNSVVQEIIQNHMYVGCASEINFNIAINLEKVFYNDEFRVRIIMNNLISNCIKYQKKDNPDKMISISVDANDSELFIEIKDNGMGIPSGYQSKIFDMFFRATDQESGSGIGLYIVKEALDKLNGTIQVESVEGEGTSFKVSIPFRTNELVKEKGLSV